MADDKQTTTVDPNYSDQGKTMSEKVNEVGATKEFEHPLNDGPVDGNYSDSGAHGDVPVRKRASTEGGSLDGVEGAEGSKYTDSATEKEED